MRTTPTGSLSAADTSDGPWRLQKEDYEGYWIHPIETTRLFGRKKIASTLNSEYLVFAWHRRWYNTITREFQTTTEVVRTFDEVIADGKKAIYDYHSGRYVYAEGAMNRG